MSLESNKSPWTPSPEMKSAMELATKRMEDQKRDLEKIKEKVRAFAKKEGIICSEPALEPKGPLMAVFQFPGTAGQRHDLSTFFETEVAPIIGPDTGKLKIENKFVRGLYHVIVTITD